MRTALPISAATTADPRGLGRGLAQSLNPELGQFWFYGGKTLAYRVVRYRWPEENLVMVLAPNIQPPAAEDELGALAMRVSTIRKRTRAIPCRP